MDDEGYTSPSEECGFIYPSHQQPGQRVAGGANHEGSICSSVTDHGEDDGENEILWYEIAKEPYVKTSFITWDDVLCPFPLRKRDVQNVNKRNRRLLSQSFLSDNSPETATMVDNIWKISQPKLTSEDIEPNTVDEIKKSNQDLSYITLDAFIDHLLHLLCGRESQSFNFIRNESKMMRKFQKNPYTIIHGMTPSSLTNYSQPFIQCGSIYRKLWLVAYQLKQDDVGFGDGVSSGHGEIHSGTSAVFVAFQKFIGDYLKLYQTVLMLKARSLKMLTTLSAFIKPLRFQLRMLEYIVDTKLNGNSVLLLTELNELLFTDETPYVGDLLRSLFVTCASAYLKYISDWVFRGDLGPPSEFHIQMEKNRDQGYKDRRFWTKQFTQNDHVPQFLLGSLELIFETGKGICLFNMIKDAHMSESGSSSSLFSYDTDRILKAQLSFDGLHTLNKEWEVKLSSFLEEHSHLSSDVLQTIDEVISNSLTKFVEIDLQAAQQTRLEFHSKVDLLRQSNAIRSKEQKRNVHLGLDDQVQELFKRKEFEGERDRLEQIQIDRFIERKDKERAEQDKAFSQKYFGTTAGAPEAKAEGLTVLDNKGSGAIPAEVEQACSELPTLSDSLIPVITGSGDTPVMQRKSAMDSSQLVELLNEDDIPVFFKPDSNVSNGSETKRSYVRKKRKEKTMKELMTHTYKNESRIEDKIGLAEGEERFNPDKLIVKAPPSYQVDIDFKKPIMPWDQRKSAELSETLVKDPCCINNFLSQSVLIPVKAQHQMVSCAILHYFITEKKLYHHLAALNDFLLLQNGLFGFHLNELLVQEIKRNPVKSTVDLARRSGQLNLILAEALSIAAESQESNPLLKNLSFALVREKDIAIKELVEPDISPRSQSEYQILNSLRLKYIVEWPLNIIFTDDLLNHYESIFAVLMQLLRTEALVKNVFLHLKSKRSTSRQLLRLNQFRHHMLVFIRTVRSYMNVTVIHTAWTEMCSTLHQLNSVQKIYDHLVSYIKSICSNCLLGPRGGSIIKVLVRELVVIESFCSSLETICTKTGVNWDAGEELPKEDFKDLCKKFQVTKKFEHIFLESKISTSKPNYLASAAGSCFFAFSICNLHCKDSTNAQCLCFYLSSNKCVNSPTAADATTNRFSSISSTTYVLIFDGF